MLVSGRVIFRNLLPGSTLPETNIASENRWLEDVGRLVYSFGMAQPGRCELLVSRRGNPFLQKISKGKSIYESQVSKNLLHHDVVLYLPPFNTVKVSFGSATKLYCFHDAKSNVFLMGMVSKTDLKLNVQTLNVITNCSVSREFSPQTTTFF